ncbi:MAG: hypothetical protein LBH28_03590 [Oscillospiraceae bacterium]|nr:hypothetical protein [Oscillospiraceae bacterium]
MSNLRGQGVKNGAVYPHDDLTLEVDYARPFDALLDPKILAVKHEFEKHIQNEHDGQCERTAHRVFLDFLNSVKTQTSSKIANFFTAGLSMDFMVREAGLEPARH